MQNILFVCTGNICRSPTAEAVFRDRVEKAGLSAQLQCDSAATHAYHTGDHPDPRTIEAAQQRGVAMGHLRARTVCAQDYQDFDVILAMDEGHLRWLQQRQPKDSKAQLALYLEYAGITHTREVPDPYYDNAAAFERVLDLCEAASDALLKKLR